ncbi:class I adenylate-forming enzyme family protein [Spongisporangium articulatum]|uniref:Class I adenylate-forming enzyme family protein n=1 Tax=Spongisporangium articulatum TaxID=3362603 RepID=A0ABW8AJ08_9ACTN
MLLAHLPWSRPGHVPADRPCMRDEALELTYGDFDTRVAAAAEHFVELGVAPGSVVAVMPPNRVELLVAVVAAWRLGASATPVNPVLTASEATYQVADADAALIVVDDGAPDFPDRTVLHVNDLRTDAVSAPAPHEVGAGDLALLVYTSGSTGRPKGVMLSHGNIAAMAGEMVESFELDASDHCLLVLPLFHVNALCVSFLSTFLAGGQLSVLRRFHPLEFLAAIERLRPTYFSAVPTIYSHLLALPEAVQADVSSVRFAVCGAAPASTQVLAGITERFGFSLIEGYGLTEATCASASNPLHGPRKPGTVGPAIPGQTVAIMGEDGALLPAGSRGEVVIQGPTVMWGYLGRPEATAEALRGGWLHTGDVGVLDEDGYLTIVDRLKDMIIRGGENIYPKEVERVLHGHPAVLEAAVVGAPDPVYGEVPVAYVVLRPGAAATPEELRAACREDLTKIKVPTAVHVVESLPKNPVGKIDKPTLRGLLQTRALDPEGV